MNQSPNTTSYTRGILYWLLFIVGYIASGPLRLLSMHTPGRRTSKKVKLLITATDSVLLVKNTFDPAQWTLPGGGIKADEAPQTAAARELHEELGLQLEDRGLRHVASLGHRQTNLPHDYEIFSARLKDCPALKPSLEILEAGWFKFENVPEDTNFLQLLPQLKTPTVDY